MQVYLVEGSEDGPVGVYGSAGRAIDYALNYCNKNNKEEKKKQKKELFKSGFVMIYESDEEYGSKQIYSTVSIMDVL